MLLINSFCVIVIRVMIFMIFSSGVNSKVLELGESQLHGKKDQPEAITFISRSQLDLSVQPAEINFKKKISEDVNNNKLFDLVYSE